MDRDEIYRKFGPQLIEAMYLELWDEINDLRRRAGLQEKTEDQALDSLHSKHSGVQRYNWMR